MMKQFCQRVNRLFERTLRKIESLLLPFGDPLTQTFTPPNTTLTTFKSYSEVKKLVNHYNIDKIEKIRECYGTTMLLINGAPWAIDSKFVKLIEECINDEKRNKERAKRDDGCRNKAPHHIG